MEVFDKKRLGDGCKADRRDFLQVKPCSALAYRGCGILKAVMQEGRVQNAEGGY